jgi:hypothetical protein
MSAIFKIKKYWHEIMADDDQSTINNNIYSTSSLTSNEIYEHLLNLKVSNKTHY